MARYFISKTKLAIQKTSNSLKIFLVLALVSLAFAGILLPNHSANAETLGSWQNTTSYPFPIEENSCAVNSAYMYCVGGYASNSADTNNVFYAPINSSGVGTWTNTTSYPKTIESQPCVISSSDIYCVGGFASNSQDTSLVYYASVSTSGVGTWKKSTAYPTAIEENSCAVYSGYIYCVGGYASNSAVTSAVYYATLSSSGVGKWANTTSYPLAVESHSCVINSGYLYCVGGTGQNQLDTNAVYYASVSSTGVGAWKSTTSYPTTIDEQSCAVYSGYIYCIGGYAANSYFSNSVYYAPLSSSGVGSWTNTTAYPTVIQDQPCVAALGYLYCVGGYASSDDTNLVEYAVIAPPQTTTTAPTTNTTTATVTATQTTTVSSTATLTQTSTATVTDTQTTTFPTTITQTSTLTTPTTTTITQTSTVPTTTTVTSPTTSTITLTNSTTQTTTLPTTTTQTSTITQTSTVPTTTTVTSPTTSTITLTSSTIQTSTLTQTVTSATTITSSNISTTTQTITLTNTTTATSISNSTSTVTSVSTETQTSTMTTTASTTTTTTTKQLVPTSNKVKCVPKSVNVNSSTVCTSTVKSADGGRLTGTDTFSSKGEGIFGTPSCNTVHSNLVCIVTFTPTTSGPHLIIANYSGDTYHAGSEGQFKLKVTGSQSQPSPASYFPSFGLSRNFNFGSGSLVGASVSLLSEKFQTLSSSTVPLAMLLVIVALSAPLFAAWTFKKRISNKFT